MRADALVKQPCLWRNEGRAPSFELHPGIRLTTEEKITEKPVRVEEKCQAGTIQLVDRAAVAAATDCNFKTPLSCDSSG